MLLNDFERASLQDPDVLSGFLSNMTAEEFQSSRGLIEQAILKDRQSMVTLGARMIADVGISQTVKYSSDFLVRVFHEAGKTIPKNLKYVWENEVFIPHADLSTAIVEIARGNGANWWERLKLRVSMRKEFDWQ